MSDKLKDVAKQIMKRADIPEDTNFGSILAILAIISITLTLIRILQECNKNKLSQDCTAKDKYDLYGGEMRSYSMRRGWFTKMRIKKVMRQNMPTEDYAKYSTKLLNALLDVGENVTDDQVVTLVENANV